jgi:hypothetical protein
LTMGRMACVLIVAFPLIRRDWKRCPMRSFASIANPSKNASDVIRELRE